MGTSFSFAGWYKIDSAQTVQGTIGQWYSFFHTSSYCGVQRYGAMYKRDQGFIRLYPDNDCNGKHDIAVTLPLDGWFHFATTFDGASFRTYVNGVLIDQFAYASSTSGSTQLIVGASLVPLAYNWIGAIDDVYVFSRPLAAAEIATLAGFTAVPGSATDEFSPYANPSGNWTYGYKLAPSSAFQRFDTGSDHARNITGMYGWNSSTLASEPHIYFNSTSSSISFANTVSVPARTIQMHPGPTGQQAVLRWIAPLAGTYSAIGAFRGNDIGGGLRVVSIRQNAIDIYTDTITSFGQLSSFSPSVTLAAGETLDFVVDPNGMYHNDSTGLTLTISAQSGDATPPTLSNLSATTTTLTATSNEAATGYWIAVARSATAPTAAQVKARVTYAGVTIVASGSGAMTANVAKTFTMSGLAIGGFYEVYLTAEDGSGNASSPTLTSLGGLPPAFDLKMPAMVPGDVSTIEHFAVAPNPVVPYSIQCISSNPLVAILSGQTAYPLWGTVYGTTVTAISTGAVSITCAGLSRTIKVVLPVITSITPDISLFAIPTTFTVNGTDLQPNMTFKVKGCDGESVEVFKATATSTTRKFRCLPNVPASFPDAFDVRIRNSTLKLSPNISFAPLPASATCVNDSPETFADFRRRYGDRGSGATRFGELPFAKLAWDDLKTISAELAAAGVCHEPLPDDIYLLLMDGLGKWSTQLNKAQQNLSTAVQREIYTTALKVGADGASIILDVVGAGAAIRGTRKVGAAAKASGRIAKGLGRWAKVAGATGKLVLKIEAYKTLSDLVSVAAGGASLLVDDLYFSQVGLTSEQQADVVGDYASFIADAIPLGLDALPALGEFLKGSTPLRGDAKIEFVKFIVVAYTKIGSDASNEGLTWDTSKDLGLEALSTGLSFVPFAGGMYDAWRDYNDFASKLNQVFEGFDKTLDQYTAHTETLLTSSLAQKLARRFQDQEDRTGSLTAKTLLDFGKIKRGLSEQLTLTVRNVGTDSLSIGTDEIDDAAFKVDATTYTGSVVPGATCSYSITFLISYLPQERR